MGEIKMKNEFSINTIGRDDLTHGTDIDADTIMLVADRVCPSCGMTGDPTCWYGDGICAKFNAENDGSYA
jgi:hypothetical protein